MSQNFSQNFYCVGANNSMTREDPRQFYIQIFITNFGWETIKPVYKTLKGQRENSLSSQVVSIQSLWLSQDLV